MILRTSLRWFPVFRGALRRSRCGLCAALVGSSIGLDVRADGAAAAPEWLDARLGGDTTIEVANDQAYARPAPNLPTTQLRAFAFGNRLFNTVWVAAPASVDGFDGLGPLFNRVSCSGCHTRDGRGRPPEQAGAPLQGMLVRLSLPGQSPNGAPVPVPGYGDQLNEQALPGVAPEGHSYISYSLKKYTYVDESEYELAQPSYRFEELAHGPLPDQVQTSPRVAPAVFGLGLLEAVPDAEILAWADPDDANHDGISGRPNRVHHLRSGGPRLGRFGWKANQPDLEQQNASAAHGDIGLTNPLFPTELGAEAAPAAAEIDLSAKKLEQLTFYTRVLAVPAARNLEQPAVRAGARQFEQLGCAACHRPTLTTGPTAAEPGLAGQSLHPYTDLLLHDLGPALADGRSDFEASGSEWRTAPLWGLGLIPVVNGHSRYLHDGRARSLAEAILWHGGEAEASREAFRALPATDRAALLSFLEAL